MTAAVKSNTLRLLLRLILVVLLLLVIMMTVMMMMSQQECSLSPALEVTFSNSGHVLCLGGGSEHTHTHTLIVLVSIKDILRVSW